MPADTELETGAEVLNMGVLSVFSVRNTPCQALRQI